MALTLGCSFPMTLRGEAAIHVSYLIAGGPSHPGAPGPKAPATCGAAIMPVGRLMLALPVADPYLALAPTFVSPVSLDALGFVGAIDGGAAWHSSVRSWYLGTAGTVAPSYMRFCNAAWCLKEALVLYGGEVHLGTRLVRTEGEGGLTVSLTGRVLTGRPTAWYWPGVDSGAINHWLVSMGGMAAWRF